MSALALARPEIAALAPYSAAVQVKDAVRLNANESPVTSGGESFRRPLNRYPEVRPQKLRAAMASHFGCQPDNLLVTRGSSEAIDLLIRAFCRAGTDSIATVTPTFSMYHHYALVQGANTIEVPLLPEDNFVLDVDALVTACDRSTRLIFVCSPNNPTGSVLSQDALLRLLQARQERSVVVVDEAYVEFADSGSVIALLQRFPNLVVLRTLSKALGLAGARCGAAIASPELTGMLNAIQAPYALATPVVECVEDLLQPAQLTAAARAVATICDEREQLLPQLQNYRFVDQVWPSQANFFLLRSSCADALIAWCRSQNILLRDFGKTLPGGIRISVGSGDENAALLRALDRFAEMH